MTGLTTVPASSHTFVQLILASAIPSSAMEGEEAARGERQLSVVDEAARGRRPLGIGCFATGWAPHNEELGEDAASKIEEPPPPPPLLSAEN
ncbi:hypothetical protein BHE74_00027353 [Ensete ventricosum]|nr:hypothetical protein BHE74_00027353 [Ensete ventricosum]